MEASNGQSTESCWTSISSASAIFFRPGSLADLDRVFTIEQASYPADEAATYEKLQMRLQDASDVFLIAVTGDDEVIGYTCGTCSSEENLTHESMSTHVPGGSTLCIHSVAVTEVQRRKGIALRMLKAYLQYVQGGCPHLRSIRLLCKENLIQLYEKAGFTLIGPSDVVHGQDMWYEMAINLEDE